MIRGLLVNGTAEIHGALPPRGLLMSAARHEHVRANYPACSGARISLVISDRFVDSTIVYQGIVGGVSADDIAAMNRIACGDVHPACHDRIGH